MQKRRKYLHNVLKANFESTNIAYNSQSNLLTEPRHVKYRPDLADALQNPHDFMQW